MVSFALFEPCDSTNNMNATLDQKKAAKKTTAPPEPTETVDLMAPKNDPPIPNPDCCEHYTEEWAAFYAAHFCKKILNQSCPEPEVLPRVWNMPHG